MSVQNSHPKLTRDVPDSHLTEIGRVVVEWAFLEDVVNLGIAGILKLPPKTARVITDPIRGFRQRLQILRALTEGTLTDAVDREEFKAIFKAVEDAYGERNKVAHAVWWGLDDPSWPALRIANHGQPPEDFHAHDIRLVAIKVRCAQEALTTFLAKPSNFSWPRSSRSTP